MNYFIPIKLLSFWRKFRYIYYRYSSFSEIPNIVHLCKKLMCGRQRIETGCIFWDFENTRVFWAFHKFTYSVSGKREKITFSSLPALPTTRHPVIFANWPTNWPTAPDAADTNTSSPALGAQISKKPAYAVIPGIPTHKINWAMNDGN